MLRERDGKEGDGRRQHPTQVSVSRAETERNRVMGPTCEDKLEHCSPSAGA